MSSIFNTSISEEIFHDGGEMGARMREFNWASTPLGPVHLWPQSLRTSISICLSSSFPILIWWGPHLIKLYNDAYAPIIGSKHPAALGSPGASVWPEIWDTIGPMLATVMQKGEATHGDDLYLPLVRNGYPEECYFTFSYSPIRDESGSIGGIFTPVTETTDRIIGARRLRTLGDLAAAHIGSFEDIAQACAAAIQALNANPSDLPCSAIYLFDREPATANAVACTTPNTVPTINLDDPAWAFLAPLASAQTCTFPLTPDNFLHHAVSPWGDSPVEGIAVPLLDTPASYPIGFLLAAVSPRKRLDATYRAFFEQIAVQLAAMIREVRSLQRQHVLQLEAHNERTRMRELFRNAPAAIAILSGPEHCFTFVNDLYVRVVHRESAHELLGKPLLDALPELNTQPVFPDMLDRVYQTGETITGNETAVRLGVPPTEVWFNFVYQPTRNPNGGIDGILVHAVDVTTQVLARRDTETREEQFRVLANSIPQLAWMADPDGYIFWFNQRWYEYTGTTFEQMEGWGWQSVHDPEILPEVVKRFEHSLQTGTSFDMTFPLRGADGVLRQFLTRAIPVRNSDGTIVRWFGTNPDVDAQQKTEAALLQSEKLAAVGRLAASIAHEINNPLEAVINLIYLARATATNPEAQSYLDSADQELGRVAQITNQTLRFHKQQTNAAPTDILDLLTSVLTLYGSKLSREGVRLRIESRHTPPLTCFSGEIRQVIANLVGNALDAMPTGGILRLRIRPGTCWRTRRSGVRITVADNGHGMSEAVRKRIFEPFYTTKDTLGTGLGLWVSCGIVEKHHGQIRVRSTDRPGRSGTVFTLSFPFSPPDILAPPPSLPA